MAKVSVLSPADLSPRLPSSRAKVRGASSSEVCDVDKPRACVLSGGAGLGDPSAQHPTRGRPPRSPRARSAPFVFYFSIVSTRESETTSWPVGRWPFLMLQELGAEPRKG